MSKLNSWALKRAYAKGNRVKATCCVCGKGIYNRMMIASTEKSNYAHQSCAKKTPAYEWSPCW